VQWTTDKFDLFQLEDASFIFKVVNAQAESRMRKLHFFELRKNAFSPRNINYR